MPPLTVRMTHVVNLEAERVLQVVPRLFRLQPGHHGRVLGDVRDHQTTSLVQVGGDLPYPVGGRYTVSAGAQLKLAQRADVTQFTDAVVAVVVGQTMGVCHATRGLAEQRRG